MSLGVVGSIVHNSRASTVETLTSLELTETQRRGCDEHRGREGDDEVDVCSGIVREGAHDRVRYERPSSVVVIHWSR